MTDDTLLIIGSGLVIALIAAIIDMHREGIK